MTDIKKTISLGLSEHDKNTFYLISPRGLLYIQQKRGGIMFYIFIKNI